MCVGVQNSLKQVSLITVSVFLLYKSLKRTKGRFTHNRIYNRRNPLWDLWRNLYPSPRVRTENALQNSDGEWQERGHCDLSGSPITPVMRKEFRPETKHLRADELVIMSSGWRAILLIFFVTALLFYQNAMLVKSNQHILSPLKFRQARTLLKTLYDIPCNSSIKEKVEMTTCYSKVMF